MLDDHATSSSDALRRAALLAGGLVAGMLLFVLGGSKRRMRAILSRELEALGRRLLGIDRGQIVRTLGPPRTAVLAQESGICGALMDSVETWYYPMTPHAALVIAFNNNVVGMVNLLVLPDDNEAG